LGKLKGGLDSIDKKKYTDVITGVVGDIKKSSKLTAKQAEKLKTYLSEDYRKLKKA
jgi:hypothetical protein